MQDFWMPAFEHSQEVLCDQLQIIRYRCHDARYQRPYSWITIPVIVGESIVAYFVVIEEEGLIDYFDQFALRIGFLLVQSLYEQALAVRHNEDWDYEDLVNELIRQSLSEEEMRYRFQRLQLDPTKKYHTLLLSLGDEVAIQRSEIQSLLQPVLMMYSGMRIARVESDYLIQWPEGELSEDKAVAAKIFCHLEDKMPDISMKMATSDVAQPLTALPTEYHRCLRSLDIGQRLYPHQYLYSYRELGALAWLDIPSEELTEQWQTLTALLAERDQEVLLMTLREYLRHHLNYSQTAQALYVHINTVRKRVEEVIELLDVDLSDSLTRLKLEVLLEMTLHDRT